MKSQFIMNEFNIFYYGGFIFPLIIQNTHKLWEHKRAFSWHFSTICSSFTGFIFESKVFIWHFLILFWLLKCQESITYEFKLLFIFIPRIRKQASLYPLTGKYYRRFCDANDYLLNSRFLLLNKFQFLWESNLLTISLAERQHLIVLWYSFVLLFNSSCDLDLSNQFFLFKF